jgi:hypothetical protein
MLYANTLFKKLDYVSSLTLLDATTLNYNHKMLIYISSKMEMSHFIIMINVVVSNVVDHAKLGSTFIRCLKVL